VGAFHGSGTLGLTTRGSILLGYPPARFDPQAGEGLNRAERVARRHWGIAQRLAGTAIAGSSQPQAGRPAHCGGSTRPTRAECVARRHRTALSGRRVQPPRSRASARVAPARTAEGSQELPGRVARRHRQRPATDRRGRRGKPSQRATPRSVRSPAKSRRGTRVRNAVHALGNRVVVPEAGLGARRQASTSL